jgi:type III secretion protein J
VNFFSRSFPPIPRRGRWLAALALLLALGGCKVGLYSNLNEQEANEIVAALSGEGIDAAKSRVEGNNWQVEVDESRMGAALDVLRAQGLPNERYATMGEVFQKQGLVSTPSEERMRYIYAISQELSQTLRHVDGVVSARVHVVIPANDPLSEKIRPSSAAVFIKHRPDVDIRLLAPAVKDMVAHSIEGLTHDQVSLSLFEARRPAIAGAGVPRRHARPAAGAGPVLDLHRCGAARPAAAGRHLPDGAAHAAAQARPGLAQLDAPPGVQALTADAGIDHRTRHTAGRTRPDGSRAPGDALQPASRGRPAPELAARQLAGPPPLARAAGRGRTGGARQPGAARPCR